MFNKYKIIIEQMNCMPDYGTIVDGECLINFGEILNIKFFDTIVLYIHTIDVICYVNKMNK